MSTLARLYQASRKVEHWTVERNRLIAQARREGGTLREIAESAQVSHTAVAKILAR